MSDVHAIKQSVDIQMIDPAKLQLRLEIDGLMLDFESPPLFSR